ncbi:MAG: MATE family efflux transporter, partial [Candidatus Lariskella arthropodorum]
MLRLKVNIFASYLSVVIQALSMLIITRVAVNYFGAEKYGLFALVTSLFAYLTLANFGIPWAAATMHAQLKSKLEKLRLAKIAFGLTVILSILFLLIVSVVSLFSPKWIDILGEIPTEIFPLAFWFVLINLIGFIIYIPFTVFGQILIFSNLSYQVKIVDAIRYIGNVVALLLVSFIGLTMVDNARLVK